MPNPRLSLALSALGLIFCAPSAWASNCYPLSNGQCYPTMMLVDPVTGLPTSGGGGGGGSGGVNTNVIVGQVKIATTGTRVQLPSNALANGLIVKSLSANAAAGATIGGASVSNAVDGTGNGYVLAPGEASSFAVSNSNLLYVNGTAGDIFTYEGN